MLGVVSLFVWMLYRPQSTSPVKIFLLIAGWMAFGPLSTAVMNAENAAIPWKFDLYLYSIDKSMGFSAFDIARLFSDWQRRLLFIVYETLGYWMILCYGLNLQSKEGKPKPLLLSYVIAYGLGPLFYLAVPACGPRHAFPSIFPAGNPEVAIAPVKLAYWPNAIPSLHLATAVILVHFAGSNRFVRWFSWLYLACTAAATIAFEHYVIDLVVGVPYAYFAIRLAQRDYQRAFRNLAMVLVWLAAIRFATPQLVAWPLLIQAMVIATLAICWLGRGQVTNDGLARRRYHQTLPATKLGGREASVAH